MNVLTRAREVAAWPGGICLLFWLQACTSPEDASVDESLSNLQDDGSTQTNPEWDRPWIEFSFTRPWTEAGEGEDPELDDELAALIESAKGSIDMAIYDFDRPLIMDAVESAWERGIQLRVVADEDEADDEGFEFLEDLGVPVVYRPSSSRIMHNKFVVLDEQVVWTGSTNLTDTGVERNNNHAVSIAHSGLAAAYTMEFEQMYIDEAFGRSKDDVLATHEFSVAGAEVELYFSPQDDPHSVVIEAIEDADHRIEFMIFTFTHDDVAAALIAAQDRGVEVVGIVDKAQARGRYSVDDELAIAGIPVLIDGNENVSGWAGGKLHHKVLVVDAGTPSLPTIISGSMNWTGAGTTDNDENVLLIQDAEIAQLMADEFCSAYAFATVHPFYDGEVPNPCYPYESPETVPLEDAQVFVNEVLIVDATGGRAGSFIELLHTSDNPVELDGASLNASAGTLIQFESYLLEPGRSLVLCGSVAPADLPCDVEVDGELGLEWGGEVLELFNGDGELTDALYLPPALPGTSLNRSPDGDGQAQLVRHDDVSATGLSSSPGVRADGTAW